MKKILYDIGNNQDKHCQIFICGNHWGLNKNNIGLPVKQSEKNIGVVRYVGQDLIYIEVFDSALQISRFKKCETFSFEIENNNTED